MDEQRATAWSADSAAPTPGIMTGLGAIGLSASPGVLLLASLFTSFASRMSRGMFLSLLFVDVILVAVPAGLAVLMWFGHRRKRREVIRLRLSHAEIAVTRADGTTGRYPTSALTGVLADREQWTDAVYMTTTVLEFRRLTLTFGDVAEQTRPGRAEDDKSFGAILAGLGVPIERGLYIDYDTTA